MQRNMQIQKVNGIFQKVNEIFQNGAAVFQKVNAVLENLAALLNYSVLTFILHTLQHVFLSMQKVADIA